MSFEGVAFFASYCFVFNKVGAMICFWVNMIDSQLVGWESFQANLASILIELAKFRKGIMILKMLPKELFFYDADRRQRPYVISTFESRLIFVDFESIPLVPF